MSEQHYDLIVVGRGPIGLAMTLCAAQKGMSVALIERHRDLYGLPRAGHLDHEIVRLLQSLGVSEAMLADSYPTTDYTWVNASGETLLEFDWGEKSVSGYNSDYMQFQPVFENAMAERIEADPNVTELLGWEASGLEQRADGVAITIAKSLMPDSGGTQPGTERRLEGAWLCAADGAGSRIRESLGIKRDDLGFNEQWLVVDAKKRRELEFEFDCGQICDPRRPVTVLPLGKRHRRWEWAVLPGEDPESLMSDEAAWKLLGEQGMGPDDLEIVRQLVYTFEARIARRWREGRVFLIGDAAHTMPPFMGQGMCSGMRDARNLAWKLDLVHRGLADQSLLDTYESEREPHTRDWTVISLEAGKVPCTLDPEEAKLRDQKFRDGWMPPMPVFPRLGDGVLARHVDALSIRAGELSLQARIEKDGESVLADDVFGADGFTLLCVGAAPDLDKLLSDEAKAIVRALDIHTVSIGDHAGAHASDAEGRYVEHFGDHGVVAMLVRPDFYVFGTATGVDDIDQLVTELGTSLHLQLSGSRTEPVGA